MNALQYPNTPKSSQIIFSDQRLKEKGFGFLRPDDGGADLFAPLRNFSGDEESQSKKGLTRLLGHLAQQFSQHISIHCAVFKPEHSSLHVASSYGATCQFAFWRFSNLDTCRKPLSTKPSGLISACKIDRESLNV